MQIAFLVLIVLLLIAVAGRQWLVTAPPTVVVQLIQTLGWTLLGIALFVVALRGGAGMLLALAPALLPVFLGWRARRRRAQAAQGPSPGQTSEVETRFLRMQLDHDSGEMRGEVIDGPYRGRTLEQLDLPELLELWRDCSRQDPQSASVLEAYLDRRHGDAWRDAAEQAPPHTSDTGPMSQEEACEILGLEPHASADEIRAAHRRLMQKLHPDHGGSHYLATKINQAKDRLLADR